MNVRILGVLAGFAMLSTSGCGDNTRSCGPGTEDDGSGICVPTMPAPPTCTGGTRLNTQTNTCELDPAACQNGTVLINGACVDPTKGLFPDVEEGAEPNGIGIGGEPSLAPAGTFTLKPIGGPGTILHGRITPATDRDDDGQLEADYDTYIVDVTAPALLRITADGVNGLGGGFVVVSDVDRLESWVRYGVNTTGDTAERTVYLPAAGRYAIAIADTRSILLGTAVGDPNAEYYVTIEQLAIPTPEPLTVLAQTATKLDTIDPGETKFYAPISGAGLSEIDLSSDTSSLALVVASDDGDVRNAGAETATSPASLIAHSDVAMLIAVEPEINTGTGPTTFTLRFRENAAAELSRTGGGATANQASSSPTAISEAALFTFEATTAGELLALDIAWNQPVDGVLLDDRGRVISPFSWDPGFGGAFGLFAGFGNYTWDGYRGVFRAPAAGRYYFLVFAPNPVAALLATSTITTLPVPTAIALGTPLTAIPPGTVLDYAGTPEAWQRFTLTSAAGSSGAHASFYDAATAAGRLGDLTLTDPLGGPDVIDPGDGVPVVDVIAAPNNTGAAGHVMLGAPQHLLGIVQTDRPFDIAITRQTFIDDGARAPGFTITHFTQALDATTFRRLYLIRSSPSNLVQVRVTPTTPTLDVEIASLRADESVIDFADNAGAGLGELQIITVDDRGYAAIQVASAGANGTGTFDVQIEVFAPTYTIHPATAAWSNACTGGTDVTPADRDDGFTSAITLPAGFELYGAPATAMMISTNGWLTFDTTTPITAAASRNEQRLPSTAAPNDLIAAYWDDLDQIRICTKVTGSRLTVQWRGVLFNDPGVRVAAQAVLDTADDSITLVYAPYMEATGASASAGVELNQGTDGTSVFFRSNSVVPGSATRLTHP
jgi:hypothetical protein